MARRSGGDKLFQRRKEALKKEAFKREKDKLSKRPDIIISCEDAISAPTYFQEIIYTLIIDKKITPDSFVLVAHDGGTQPSKVLERLKNYKDINGKTYKDFEHKWIVIDRDVERVNGGGHSAEDFNNTINSCKSSKSNLNIDVAYANDSFELWYLLHFDYICTPFLRDEINKKLITKLKRKIHINFLD